MKILTCEQTRALERNQIERGSTYFQLMNNAGVQVGKTLISQMKANSRSTVAVLCGKGNNGGDGFVLARAAALDGWQVTVLLAEGEPKTPDAITNYTRLEGLGIAVCRDAADLEPQHFRVVADALYGTGFHGSLRPAGRAACALIHCEHEAGAFVLALDLPSGIATDTGEVAEGAVSADLTVTFDSYKPLHAAKNSAVYCGEIVCADIGIGCLDDAGA